MEKKPADIELAGRTFHFTEDTTLVCAYPLTPMYDHIELDEYKGTMNHQRILLWNAGKLACYLSGIIIGDIILDDVEGSQLAENFYERYGWNAPVMLRARVEPYIMEKYIGAMTQYLIDIPTFKKEDE